MTEETLRVYEAAIEWLSRDDRNRFAWELYRDVLPLLERADDDPALMIEAIERTRDFVRRLMAAGG